MCRELTKENAIGLTDGQIGKIVSLPEANNRETPEKWGSASFISHRHPPLSQPNINARRPTGTVEMATG